MTFHEEVAFRRSRELQFDIDMEEHETPTTQIPTPVSPRTYIQREEPKEILDQYDHVKPVELVERSLDAPATKRKHA